jgi:predicted naringenin-chalcone synthase
LLYILLYWLLLYTLLESYYISHLPTSLSPYLPTSLPPYLPTSLSPYLPISLPPYLSIYSGRKIIEQAQNGLHLTSKQAADSWYILEHYGNMLSPSVMFVLERIFARNKKALAQGEAGVKMGLAFSFSPGVGAEGLMLQQVN